MSNYAVQCSNIHKAYPHQAGEVRVLAGAGLSIQQGELVALIGPSGSGKSTLLHMIGLLDTVDEGSITHFGDNTTSLGDDARTALRRDAMGFVYQAHHLLPELSALENVCMPLWLQGKRSKETTDAATQVLGHVGLKDRIHHKPSELSGGEAQRVAIARALVHSPKLLLADEPTGNLDPTNAKSVLDYLINACREKGASALVVTHSMDVARALDRSVRIENGKIVQAAL